EWGCSAPLKQSRDYHRSGYALLDRRSVEVHFASVTEWADGLIGRATPYMDIAERAQPHDGLPGSGARRLQKNPGRAGRATVAGGAYTGLFESIVEPAGISTSRSVP